MFLEVDTAEKQGVLQRALAIYGRVLMESVKGKEHLLQNNADYQIARQMMRDLKHAESAVVEELARIALEKLQKEWRNG